MYAVTQTLLSGIYDGGVANDSSLVEALLTLSRPIVGIGVRSVQAAAGSVTMPQYRVLVLLDDNASLSIGAIAAELGVNPSNATRVCDRLERLGLIARTTTPHDRRTVLVRITRQGRDVVAAVMAYRRRELARVVEMLDGSSNGAVVRALDEVAVAARALERAHLAQKG
jgi:DNA-binding MarR family transcriptional regulator